MVRVLVVDDDPDIRLMVRVVLARPGVEVLEARDGAAGLELARTTRPDLCVLDHRMPVLSGTEVAAALLADGHTGRLVVFSAHLDATLTARVDALGLESIVKSDVDRLVEVLGEVSLVASA